MPHIAVTMYPGRDDKAKREMAIKLQNFLAEELAIDKKVVSVSIEDIPVEDWDDEMKKISPDTLFVPGG